MVRHALHGNFNPHAPSKLQAADLSDDGIIDSGLHPGSAIGVAIVDDHVLVRSTRIGDLNSMGGHDFRFHRPASTPGLTGTATWQEGDLNSTAAVSISDFIESGFQLQHNPYAGDSWPISDADGSAGVRREFRAGGGGFILMVGGFASAKKAGQRVGARLIAAEKSE
jgi:hypothetical protein